MKKLLNISFIFIIFILLIISCKSKTVEPDLSTIYEVKTDEFIKVEIDGKQFDYRTILKADYQTSLKSGRTSGMLECAECKNSMFIFFAQKIANTTTTSSTEPNIEKITVNQLVDANTPVFYVGFRFEEKIESGKNGNVIYFARTAPLESGFGGGVWPSGNMIVKITSNENGMVSGTFSGKDFNGKEIKNGSFSLKYKL